MVCCETAQCKEGYEEIGEPNGQEEGQEKGRCGGLVRESYAMLSPK